MNGRFDPVLGELYGFDEATLAANRAGQITPRQQHGFAVGATAYRSNAKVVIVMVGVAIVVSFGITLAQSSVDAGQILLVGGALLVAGGAIGLIIRRNYTQAGRFEQPVAVQVAEGPLEVDEHPYSWSDGDHTTGWKVTVGEKSWRLLEEYAEPFERGAVYRFYYVDFGGPALTILSIERAV